MKHLAKLLAAHSALPSLPRSFTYSFAAMILRCSATDAAVPRRGMTEDAGTAPIVVDPMGQMDGWVDPEIENMQNMIHGAIDMAFEDRNRAKEGKTSFGGTYYRGPSKAGSSCAFKLYALSGRLDHLPRGATKEEIVAAMKGKVLAKASLSGVLR